MRQMVAEYGTALTLNFVAVDPSNPERLATGVTMASGDTQISTDNGSTFSNTTNTPSFANGVISIDLTSSEMTDDRVIVKLEDQTATEEYADDMTEILTKGNTSAFYGQDTNLDSSGNVTVATNNDKTGYSLSQSFPTNFADLSITATTGLVSVDDSTPVDANVAEINGNAITGGGATEADYV